jgi:hypothetical protein
LGYRKGRSEGALYKENSDMQFFEGRGMRYPITKSWAPRIWNGRIIYYLDVN